MYKRFLAPLLLFAIVFVQSCAKQNIDNQEENPSETNISTTNNDANRLKYIDTLLYLKNVAGNYVITPVSKPNIIGYFKAIPGGLSIDSTNGKIDINASFTGIKYKIYYVQSSTGDAVDSTKLTISGIDYKDAIYELAATPNNYDTAFPIYNANSSTLLPCSDGDDDDDDGCVFDETDIDNDGNDDIPGVIQSKLLIDIKKGTIDLEASFFAGVFGSSEPANGEVRDFKIFYRLKDVSGMALNNIDVRLHHFKKRSDIPQELIDIINFRNSVSNATNNLIPFQNSASNSLSNFSGSVQSFRFYDIYSGPRRPPFIIIVSQ